MKNLRVNPIGAAAVLLGILVVLGSLFACLWQSHPDPSAFKPEEFGGLMLRLKQGEWAVLVDGKPQDVDSLNYDDRGNPIIDFPHETVVIVAEKGKVEVPLKAAWVLGGLIFCGGVVLSFKMKLGGKKDE